MEVRNLRCLLCDAAYKARDIREKNAFCPKCFTETRRRELRRVNKNLLRAKKAGELATLTAKQWLCILDHFNWQCAYCPKGKFQVLEHITPLSLGAGTTIFNCVPACISCNIRKDGNALDKISTTRINHIKEQLEAIAKVLGVRPGDLIVPDEELARYGEQPSVPGAA